MTSLSADESVARLSRYAALARSVWELSWSDRLEASRLFLLAVIVDAGLRFTSLPRIVSLLRVETDFESTEPTTRMTHPLPEWARRRVTLAQRILNHAPGGPTCLRTSLVCGARLRPLEPKLRIGVKRVEGELTAHAWLEIDKQYFDDIAAEFDPIQFAGR